MENVIKALEDFPHVQVVYMVGKDWYFNKPNFEHIELTRGEVLGLKKETKTEKKERERLEAEALEAERLKAEAEALEAERLKAEAEALEADGAQ